MSWYVDDLPSFIPICRKMRQGQFSKRYELESWSYDALIVGFGQGVRDWVSGAVADGRKLCMHGFIPGDKLAKIYTRDRYLYTNAWEEIAKYIQFSFYLESDCWYDLPILEARKLQFMTIEIGKDMHAAGIPMIWLLLETRAGGMEDINFYANFANRNHMRWVCHNLTGARDKKTMMEQLQVYAAYQDRLDPKIGIVVNGPSSENRIRMIYRIFEGREVVITNAARIENVRRGFSSVL